jgi:hypothetical protein
MGMFRRCFQAAVAKPSDMAALSVVRLLLGAVPFVTLADFPAIF